MSDDQDLDLWNAELEEEVQVKDLSTLIVYSRDWTVETIFSQIQKENIDLEPAFQRRNAWNDHKRGKLIESLIARLPVPQIVLAEDQYNKGKFLVIDGKQRLLALSGFIDPNAFPSWQNPRLLGLTTREDLNGISMTDLQQMPRLGRDHRQFLNADIRCTIITGYKSDQVLFDIFYRLNSASVPLSSQELRQVLNRGEFSRMIMEETNKKIPLHEIMGLSGPDARLRDAEILLRYVGIKLFGKSYNGNLSSFLDETLKKGNREWKKLQGQIRQVIDDFNRACQLVIDVFPEGKAGRKFASGKWESRFNRVLLEVEVYYFDFLTRDMIMDKRSEFVSAFEEKLGENQRFLESIESTTKTIERYFARFQIFEEFINEFFNIKIEAIPTKSLKTK